MAYPAVGLTTRVDTLAVATILSEFGNHQLVTLSAIQITPLDVAGPIGSCQRCLSCTQLPSSYSGSHWAPRPSPHPLLTLVLHHPLMYLGFGADVRLRVPATFGSTIGLARREYVVHLHFF